MDGLAISIWPSRKPRAGAAPAPLMDLRVMRMAKGYLNAPVLEANLGRGPRHLHDHFSGMWSCSHLDGQHDFAMSIRDSGAGFRRLKLAWRIICRNCGGRVALGRRPPIGGAPGRRASKQRNRSANVP